jgi:uncharacterized UPF0160 family protein
MDKKKVTIVTYSSKFHVDDLFAVAALSLLLEKNSSIEIIRTREQAVISTGDYVVDVGGVYDPSTNRFDHHQFGGAGEGNQSIPYSSFGLVWKHFGNTLCGDNSEVADVVNKVLVQPIDAHDNGVEIIKESVAGLRPYDLSQLKYIILPTWKESDDIDKVFAQTVKYAQWILSRQIKVASDQVEGRSLVYEKYQNATDKRIIEVDERLPWKEVLAQFSEPMYVIYNKRVDNTWSIKTVSVDPDGVGILEFVPRKAFPSEWAGKSGEDLEKVTKVEGSLFSHRNRFLTVVKTREAALQIAQLALDA